MENNMETEQSIRRIEAQRQARKRYYEAHKQEIYQKKRESGRYKKNYMTVYANHRDEYKAKALARYYYNKACREFGAIEI